MFDANMRYLPEGKQFFAEVHFVDEGSLEERLGLIAGQVVLCEMLEQTSDNPLVEFTLDGRKFRLRSNEEGYSWLVYSGDLDLTGFICEESRQKAKHVLSKMYHNIGKFPLILK